MREQADISEARQKQLAELIHVVFHLMERISRPFAGVDRPVRGRDDQVAVGDEHTRAFVKERGRVRDVFERLERDRQINRSVRQGNAFGISHAGVQAVLAPGVLANVRRDIDADHVLLRPGIASRLLAILSPHAISRTRLPRAKSFAKRYR